MTPSYIALGSNLCDPLTRLRQAVSALETLPETHVNRLSSIYTSKAVGPCNQPDYLNAVALVTTGLSPLALLDALQQIEQQQGRVRDIHWGPRTLDLDILLYGDQRIVCERLTVPHPEMTERNFVLYPLREISNTNLVLPNGKDLDTLIRQCPENGLEKTQYLLRDSQFPEKK